MPPAEPGRSIPVLDGGQDGADLVPEDLPLQPSRPRASSALGGGSYLSPASGVDINSFAYFLTDRGNGTARGLVYWQLPNITVVWRVTSFGFYEFTPGTTSLAFAGPIVSILGTPRPGVEVGSTATSQTRYSRHS